MISHLKNLSCTPLTTFFNLRSGAIDLYIGYSGTGMMLAGMPVSLHTAESGRERLNRIYESWGVKWLPSIGFQNQEKLVMRKKKAEELDIHTMTDLAEHSEKLIFGANREYFLRDWAFPRLERLGMPFENICEVDINDRLSGLLAGEFDVGVIWTTDPEMDDPRLTVVEPDERFPSISQYAMPVCRDRVLPAVEPVLSRLQITEMQMRKLNRLARRAGNTPLAIKGLADDFVRGRL